MTQSIQSEPQTPAMPDDGRCLLCEQPSHLTFHHLVPKQLHGKRQVRLRYSAQALRHHGIWICRACHTFLHATFDARTLATHLDSLDALRVEPAVMRHLTWASKQRRRV